MITYLLIGLWTYITLICCRSDGFFEEKDADWWFKVTFGAVLGILLWPLAPFFCLYIDLGKIR